MSEVCEQHREAGFIYTVIGCPRCYPVVADRSAAEALSADRAWKALTDLLLTETSAAAAFRGGVTDVAAVVARQRPIIEAVLDRERAAALPERVEIVRRYDLEVGSDPEHDFDGPDPWAAIAQEGSPVGLDEPKVDWFRIVDALIDGKFIDPNEDGAAAEHLRLRFALSDDVSPGVAE